MEMEINHIVKKTFDSVSDNLSSLQRKGGSHDVSVINDSNWDSEIKL